MKSGYVIVLVFCFSSVVLAELFPSDLVNMQNALWTICDSNADIDDQLIATHTMVAGYLDDIEYDTSSMRSLMDYHYWRYDTALSSMKDDLYNIDIYQAGIYDALRSPGNGSYLEMLLDLITDETSVDVSGEFVTNEILYAMESVTNEITDIDDEVDVVTNAYAVALDESIEAKVEGSDPLQAAVSLWNPSSVVVAWSSVFSSLSVIPSTWYICLTDSFTFAGGSWPPEDIKIDFTIEPWETMTSISRTIFGGLWVLLACVCVYRVFAWALSA